MPFSLYRSRRARQRRRRVLLLAVLAGLSALALYLFAVGEPPPSGDESDPRSGNDATAEPDAQEQRESREHGAGASSSKPVGSAARSGDDEERSGSSGADAAESARSKGDLRLSTGQKTATASSGADGSGREPASETRSEAASRSASNSATDADGSDEVAEPGSGRERETESADSPDSAGATLDAESARSTEIMRRPTATRTPAARTGQRDLLARARGAPFVPPPPLFRMQRPFQGEGLETRGSAFYPYGSDGGGEYLLHHGIDISNVLGTPVRAVADGEVVFAGEDREGQPWGKPDERAPSGFYGRLVVVRHALELDEGPLFSLYGHLSETQVRRRQFVRAGEVVGRVGAEGVALGPHLHLEIRLDARDYGATLNPELFVEHLPERGAIVGRVSDSEGAPIPSVDVGLYRLEAGGERRWLRQATTYPEDPVNALSLLGENFVFADLETGVYTVMAETPGGRLSREVTVLEGLPSGIVLRR